MKIERAFVNKCIAIVLYLSLWNDAFYHTPSARRI